MKTKLIACAALLMAACCGSPSARKAAATKTEVKHGPEIVLAAPDTVGGTSVNEALANRRSWREYAAAPLTLEELSGVVWAAAGINRPGTDRLTAPSALALRKGRPFSCRRWTGRDLSPRFGRRPPEGRLSDASGAARRPNPGLAATRCLLRNNATAARPSGPAGYGRCGAAPAPLRASRGARAGPPSGRDAVRRAVRRPWRGSSR